MEFPNQARVQEWWQAKAGMILAIVYLVIAITQLSWDLTLLYFLPAVLTILGIGAFGHLINDWFDIDSDAKAGKKNRLAQYSFIQKSGIVLLALAIAFAPWILLPFDQNSIYLIGFEFLLLLLYAIPPIRFKERAILGIITDSLYAYAIPTVLAAYTFFLIASTSPDFTLLSLIFLWQLFIGLHNILIHQLSDYDNDINSATKTFATKYGQQSTSRLIVFYIWLPEIILFLVVTAYLSYNYFSWYFLLPFTLLFIKYYYLFQKASIKFYSISTNEIDQQAINIHYHKFLPYWHSLYCFFIHPIYLFIPVAHYFLIDDHKNYKRKIFILVYTYLVVFIKAIKTALSKVVNYSIYYFRRIVLFQSKEQAMKEHYEGHIAYLEEKKRQSEMIRIAIFNKNKDKYTETFVGQHIKKLAYHKLFFYDGYLPHQLDGYGELLNSKRHDILLRKCLKYLQGLPKDYYLKKAIQEQLLKHKTQLVLAEFGTTGAHIVELCKTVQVPVICIFYGYDAFHKEILKDHKKAYQQLFSYASKLIGVSKDITHQLQKLGAPKEKIEYLPCAVNLDLFQYSNHSKNPIRFLMVGRFTNTKSPQISLLAFQQVLKKYPEASLDIIGKPTELYESCLILAKTLGIEKNISFLGIQSPQDVRNKMKSASVFIQHSVTTPHFGDKEGTPVAIMEAMASGLPVVATRHAGIAEMIASGETGFLVDELDWKDMAAKMILLIENEPLAESIGQKASHYIHQHPLIKNHIPVLSKIIEDVINAPFSND